MPRASVDLDQTLLFGTRNDAPSAKPETPVLEPLPPGATGATAGSINSGGSITDPPTAPAHQGGCRIRHLLLALGTIALLTVSALVGVILVQRVAVRTSAQCSECGPHGQCELINGELTCACAAGWAGSNCAHATGCDDEPCKHGTCNVTVGLNYTCTCEQGYAGINCTHATGCDKKPCLNGGTCKTGIGKHAGEHRCTCSSGWLGFNCAHYNCCLEEPCHNGGTCTWINGTDSCQCACMSGWTGANCTHATGCDNNPCNNHETCIASGGDHTCACKSGWAPPPPLSSWVPRDGNPCVLYNQIEKTASGMPNTSLVGAWGYVKCRNGTSVPGCAAFGVAMPCTGAGCVMLPLAKQTPHTGAVFSGTFTLSPASFAIKDINSCNVLCLKTANCVQTTWATKVAANCSHPVPHPGSLHPVTGCDHCHNGGKCYQNYFWDHFGTDGQDSSWAPVTDGYDQVAYPKEETFCMCASGWDGMNCTQSVGCGSVMYPTARDNPCGNGATCTATGINYSCACDGGWHCNNHQTCMPKGGIHKCACASGWEGADCSHGYLCTHINCAVHATRSIDQFDGPPVVSVAWSPDGTMLIAAGDGSSIGLNHNMLHRDIDVYDWYETWDDVSTSHSMIPDMTISSIAWSPDGTMLAAGGLTLPYVNIWHQPWEGSESGPGQWKWTAGIPRPGPWTRKHELTETRAVTSVAWSPDSTMLASGSDDCTVKLYKADGVHSLRLHSKQGSSCNTNKWLRDEDARWPVSWSPDGTTLACGCPIDGIIQLWKANGTRLRNLSGNTGAVFDIAWSSDGTLASGLNDGTIKLWEADGTPLRILTGHTDYVLSLAWSYDGTTLASGSRDNTIRLWNANGTLLQTIGLGVWVHSVAWSPDGTTLASGLDGGTIKLFKAADMMLPNGQQCRRAFNVTRFNGTNTGNSCPNGICPTGLYTQSDNHTCTNMHTYAYRLGNTASMYFRNDGWAHGNSASWFIGPFQHLTDCIGWYDEYRTGHYNINDDRDAQMCMENPADCDWGPGFEIQMVWICPQ